MTLLKNIIAVLLVFAIGLVWLLLGLSFFHDSLMTVEDYEIRSGIISTAEIIDEPKKKFISIKLENDSLIYKPFLGALRVNSYMLNKLSAKSKITVYGSIKHKASNEFECVQVSVNDTIIIPYKNTKRNKRLGGIAFMVLATSLIFWFGWWANKKGMLNKS
ncbi:MAG: hypothetical protein JKY53_04000 [Flavobacteriales bacterium]|nr:hypothetical protein [Flavobacteriales bacterium]